MADVSTVTRKGAMLALCSCERSFSPDEATISRGLKTAGQEPAVVACSQLCGADRDMLGKFAGATSVTIACEQEQAALRTGLSEAGFTGEARFVDIRDRAGWSSEGAEAAPKMAALLAAAQLPAPALPFFTMESQGVTLVYGRDEVALEVAARLADTLDITVMLAKPGAVMPPRNREFPIACGIIRQAKGHLGTFELTLDNFALASPASRQALVFGPTRNGAQSRCDVLIDLTGGQPLFSADELRDGYLRADPRDQVGVEKLIAKARDLVGTFDKPKYITFHEDLCAHSRSKITGCTRCLEVCPTGAISPNGDRVAIDPGICAGCGSCASVCPTGAASYALPAADDLMKRLRVMLRAYRGAGGERPVMLFHDGEHGLPLIDALARFGEGLPANVIPVQVNEVTQIGLEQLAASFAYGAAGVAFLIRSKPKHDPLPLAKLASLATELLPALGYPKDAVSIVSTDDPDQLFAGPQSHARECGRGGTGHLPAHRREAPGDDDGLAGMAECRPGAPGQGGAPRRFALRHGECENRGLHALPCLRFRLPGLGADREPRAAGTPLPGGSLRAMRPLPGDLPGEGHLNRAADRFRAHQRRPGDAEGGRALPLRQLREALRHQIDHRAHQGETHRPALDVFRPECRSREAHRLLRRLPRGSDDQYRFRPLCRHTPAARAHHRGLHSRKPEDKLN